MPLSVNSSSCSLIAAKPHPNSLAEFSVPEPTPLPGQRYRLGDMLWAKVGSHPYWPCMVYYGPESNAICRPHSKAGTRFAYHVQFFGPLVERAWVPDNANLLKYGGKAAFDEYVEEQGWRTKAARAQFEVRPRIQPLWEASWREADEALQLPHLERMFRYGRVYYDDSAPPPAAVKPIADKRKSYGKTGKTDSDSDWSEQRDEQQHQRVATSSSKKRHWTPARVQQEQEQQQPREFKQEIPESADPDAELVVSDASDSEDSSDSEIDSSARSAPARFQFQRLSPPPPLGPARPASWASSGPAPVCGRCEEPADSTGSAAGSLVPCQGPCAKLYHPACLLRRQPKLLCDSCCRPDRPGGACQLCCQPVDIGDDVELKRRREVCQKCSMVYHSGCLDQLLDAARCAGLGAAASLRLLVRRDEASSDGRGGLIACPRHACRSCVIDGCPVGQAAVGVQVSCVRCPTAYHSSRRCIPAGSQFLTDSSIVCPDHLLSDSTKRRSSCSATATRHVNTSWCFVCLRSGLGLTGCQRCPASYHLACLPSSASASIPFTCFNCRLGWQPRCGDPVWVKVGPFRWWPCEILLADHAPQNIQRLGRQLGTFPVRFFGTDEYYWVSLARLFPFRDGDLGEAATAAAGSAGTETPELMDKFNEGVALAQEIWRLRDRDRCDSRRLLGEQAVAAPSGVPPPAVEADQRSPLPAPSSAEPQQQPAEASAASSLMAKCDCQRRGRRCDELDGCANRLSGIECHPAACGTGCLNQRLSRPVNQQPELALFKRPRLGPPGQVISDASSAPASSCGWAVGLAANSSTLGGRIPGGQAVLSDLPGDLIDPAEARRRVRLLGSRRLKSKSKPLMLQLDWRRVLDLGGLAARLAAPESRPQRRANARLERWSSAGGAGGLRVGIFAVGVGASPGEELLVDWDGAACGGTEESDAVEAGEAGECPDLWNSPLCPACDKPISMCQRHRQPQSQVFHIRCLQCSIRYHAECARLLAGAETFNDAALDRFYCDSCLFPSE